ncbi:MAG: MmcQ/YjbR family DNA-binding protein [Acidobacteriota bacterium]
MTRPLTFDTVRRLGLALPGVEEGTTYRSPALKLRGKVVACLAIHRSAEPNTLVVVIGFDERDQLLAADPGTYYVTDHYVNYASILVRLSRIHQDALRDLLKMAWQFVDARAARRQCSRRSRVAKLASPRAWR